jgi:hypothetical protein
MPGFIRGGKEAETVPNHATRRRSFLRQLAAGPFAAAGLGTAAAPVQAAVNGAEPMKIIRINAVTFRKDLQIGGGSGGRQEAPEWCWVQLHIDSGLVGTGETCPWDNGQIGALKDHARQLLGREIRGTSMACGVLFTSILRCAARAAPTCGF